MDDFVLARIIHVLSVVVWIGGVYFVTFVAFPLLKNSGDKADDKVSRFEAMEIQFTKHAKIVVTMTGLSGFYMLYSLDGWEWYQNAEYWWIHAMTILWVIFTFVLFIAEPLFLHAWFICKAGAEPDRTLAIVTRFHQIMTGLSLFVIAAAIIGVHG